jgi:HEAT repeat protein
MLAERQDRGKAVEALKAIGPPAEDAVIPFLSHGDDHVRSEACKILQVIGSEKSVPMLRTLVMNKVGFSDGAARDALNAMRLRGVNLNVANKKKRR